MRIRKKLFSATIAV